MDVVVVSTTNAGTFWTQVYKLKREFTVSLIYLSRKPKSNWFQKKTRCNKSKHFTAWRYASAVAMAVCLSICLSQMKVLSKLPNLSSHKQCHAVAQGLACEAKDHGEIPMGSSLMGMTNTGGQEKFTTFDKQLIISWKWYKIDPWFLWKVNRKLYALYQMVNYWHWMTLITHTFTFWVFLHISGKAEARVFKFSTQVGYIKRWQAIPKWCGQGHVTHFWAPVIFLEWVKLDTRFGVLTDHGEY